MTRALLLRGMLAGILAGVLAVGFGELLGERQIDRAIAFEAAMEQAAGHASEQALVSRAVQRSAGLLTAGVIYAAALGGLVALVFAFAYGRVGPVGAKPLAALIAAGGFVAVALVPQLKYPANPPAIGEPATIDLRTALYFEMIAIALAALTLAVLFGRWLMSRLDRWNASLIAIAAFIMILATVQVVLPDVSEIPDGFPADTLWRFRVASLGMQVVLWSALGVAFGFLAERGMEGGVRRRHATELLRSAEDKT